jgi:hypothetical protein
MMTTLYRQLDVWNDIQRDRQSANNVTMRRVIAAIVAVEKQSMLHIVKDTTHMRHIVVCGLSGSTVFFHIISYTTRFLKKKNIIEYKYMCFHFMYKFCLNISRSKNN